jgi:hypothetical protein
MDTTLQRKDILNRYRHLREISTRHHNAALDCVARPAMLERAKHLGCTYGQTLVAESHEVTALIFDLAVHTAKPGRSRAIDRYARAAALSPDTDEARTLDAICAASFSIWRIDRRHEAAGLIVTDVLRKRNTWLVDEGLTASGQPGQAFAGRLCWPAEFAMTCGIVVPVYRDLIEQVVSGGAAWQQHADPEQLADDPRFATAIYREAISEGAIDHVVLQDPGIAA